MKRIVEKKIVRYDEEEECETMLVPTVDPTIDPELLAARNEFAAENAVEYGEDDYYDLVSRHPDQRMIPCPPELLLESEWETRHGRGFILSDGSWFDPINQTFFGCETVD
jgi:hypothetical protein